MFSIGDKIGNYTILQILGRGGMGEVYLGEHRHIARKAAIKVIRRDGPIDEQLVARFFTEARAASLIQHPGIVEILDCDVLPSGPPYIVMEYLEGESVEACLARVPRLGGDHDAFAMIVTQVADALAAAHAKGIVHRDLKPANIFLAHGAPRVGGAVRVKVLDFGIAKLASAGQARWTQTGAMLGTPVYMSPEQCKGAGSVDHRSDIYSLGCMAYEMCCGQPPFVREGHGELIFAHMSESPPPMSSLAPHLPPLIENLVMRMLSKRPEDRPQSMEEVAATLRGGGVDAPRADRTVDLPPRGPITLPLSRPGAPWGDSGGTVPPADVTNHQTTFTQSTGVRAAPPHSPRAGRSPLALVAGAVVVAGAAAGLILWSQSPPTRSGPRPVQVVERPQPTFAPAPTDPEPAEPRDVSIRILSNPPGAEVWIEGEQQGTTPLLLAMKPSATERTVRLVREGHVTKTIAIAADRDGTFQVELERRAEKSRRTARTRRPAAPDTDGDEYKKLDE